MRLLKLKILRVAYTILHDLFHSISVGIEQNRQERIANYAKVKEPEKSSYTIPFLLKKPLRQNEKGFYLQLKKSDAIIRTFLWEKIIHPK